MNNQITMIGENGESLIFYVLEQTRIAGRSYLLAADSMEGDAQAVILRDDSVETDEESVYSFVEDDAEFDAVADVFEKMMEDVDFDESN